MHFLKLSTLGFLLLFGAAKSSFSQKINFYGARNESLARATVALTDSWSLFYNPAGLVFHQTKLAAGFQSKYATLGINDGAFGITFPIKETALGFGASYFGDQLLNKSKITGAIAHKIGKTRLGIKTAYEQISIKEIGYKGIFTIDIGGQISLNEQINIGMAITNINQAKFDTLSLISSNTSIQVGVNYHPHKQLTLLAQVEKDIEYPAILRIALEYTISKLVLIRTGVLPSPVAAFAGVGLQSSNFNLDLVGSYQQSIGWSGGLSIGVPLFTTNEK